MRQDITAVLVQYRDDPQQLSNHLIPMVYDRMRSMARKRMSKERDAFTLQPTALVHEAFLRLIKSDGPWANRAHFLGAVSEAMRRILIEQSRQRKRLRHGGEFGRSEIQPDQIARDGADMELISLSDALERFRKRHARKALVVEMRYFLGLSIPEAATALNVSVGTVKLDWSFAKAWLHRELSSRDPSSLARYG